MYKLDAKQNKIDIVYNTPESEAAEAVLADSERVSQVLQNVLRKAMRIAYKDSKIDIDCWTDQKGYKGCDRYLFFSILLHCDPITPE